MSPGEAMQSIVDLVQFVMANSSHTPQVLGNMTLPQVNAVAEAIRRFKIHAFGVGLGGKEEKQTSKSTDLGTVANEWNAAFAGFG